MKYIFIILILLISSCRWVTDAKLPNLSMAKIKIPPGTPNFRKGFADGCSTVIYSRGNTFYRTFHKFRFEADLIDDTEYYFARKRGYNFCFGYITGGSGVFGGGWDKDIYAQGTHINMGGGGNVWKSFGGDVFDSWGSVTKSGGGGVGGFLGTLQENTANSGGVLGGHIFYGKSESELKPLIPW